MPAASRKLPKHDDLIVRYAMLAERYVFDLPNSSLIKLFDREAEDLLRRYQRRALARRRLKSEK
jgi:hypothetical protein